MHTYRCQSNDFNYGVEFILNSISVCALFNTLIEITSITTHNRISWAIDDFSILKQKKSANDFDIHLSDRLIKPQSMKNDKWKQNFIETELSDQLGNEMWKWGLCWFDRFLLFLYSFHFFRPISLLTHTENAFENQQWIVFSSCFNMKHLAELGKYAVKMQATEAMLHRVLWHTFSFSAIKIAQVMKNGCDFPTSSTRSGYLMVDPFVISANNFSCLNKNMHFRRWIRKTAENTERINQLESQRLRAVKLKS